MSESMGPSIGNNRNQLSNRNSTENSSGNTSSPAAEAYRQNLQQNSHILNIQKPRPTGLLPSTATTSNIVNSKTIENGAPGVAIRRPGKPKLKAMNFSAGSNDKKKGHRRCTSEPFDNGFKREINAKKRERLKNLAGKIQLPGFHSPIEATFDDFIEKANIGAGTTGTVYKCEYQPQQLKQLNGNYSHQSAKKYLNPSTKKPHVVAIKKMLKSGNDIEYMRVLTDTSIYYEARECSHIVKWYGVLDEKDSIWIVMQYCVFGDFNNILKKVHKKRKAFLESIRFSATKTKTDNKIIPFSSQEYKSINGSHVQQILSDQSTNIKAITNLTSLDHSYYESNSIIENSTFIPEYVLSEFCKNVLCALEFLKSKLSIIHRDVRPSNILIDEKGRILLCDFGISTTLQDSKAYTKAAGVQYYISPERIFQSETVEQNGYDARSDVYAVGLSALEMAIGQHIYDILGLTNDIKICLHVQSQPSPTLPDSEKKLYSSGVSNLIDVMLTKDVKQRPKYESLLQHPYVLECRANSGLLQQRTRKWVHWLHGLQYEIPKVIENFVDSPLANSPSSSSVPKIIVGQLTRDPSKSFTTTTTNNNAPPLPSRPKINYSTTNISPKNSNHINHNQISSISVQSVQSNNSSNNNTMVNSINSVTSIALPNSSTNSSHQISRKISESKNSNGFEDSFVQQEKEKIEKSDLQNGQSLSNNSSESKVRDDWVTF